MTDMAGKPPPRKKQRYFAQESSLENFLRLPYAIFQDAEHILSLTQKPHGSSGGGHHHLQEQSLPVGRPVGLRD